eukprot:COSAG01_NODE_544_length_15682_cov_107.959379_5_plen_185_part_00
MLGRHESLLLDHCSSGGGWVDTSIRPGFRGAQGRVQATTRTLQGSDTPHAMLPTVIMLAATSTLLRVLQPAAATHANPTLESVMSFTTRGSPIASEHDHVAWVETTRGVSNIYGAVEPGLKPLRITNFTDDDAMEIELFGFYQQPSSSNSPSTLHHRMPPPPHMKLHLPSWLRMVRRAPCTTSR